MNGGLLARIKARDPNYIAEVPRLHEVSMARDERTVDRSKPEWMVRMNRGQNRMLGVSAA